MEKCVLKCGGDQCGPRSHCFFLPGAPLSFFTARRRKERSALLVLSPHQSSARIELLCAAAVMVVTRERKKARKEEGRRTDPLACPFDHRISSPLSFLLSLSLSPSSLQKNTEHLQQPGPHAGRDHPARPESPVGREPQAEGCGQAPEQFEFELELIGRRQRQRQQCRARAAPAVFQRGPDRGRGEREFVSMQRLLERLLQEAFERKRGGNAGRRGER